MDADRFDALTRFCGSLPRRTALRAAMALALFGGVAPRGTKAATFCRQPGATCRLGTQCCSGICKKNKKHGKKKCRAAFSQFTCNISQDACPQGDTINHCGNPDNICACFITADGASICGNFIEFAPDCAFCTANFPATVCVKGGSGSCIEPFGCVQPCAN